MKGYPVKATQELIVIDPDELSIVDTAANLQEFLIIKNLNGARTVIKPDEPTKTDVAKGDDGTAVPASGQAPAAATAASEPAANQSSEPTADAIQATVQKTLSEVGECIAEITKAGSKMSAANVEQLQTALGSLEAIRTDVIGPADPVQKQMLSAITGLTGVVETLQKQLKGEPAEPAAPATPATTAASATGDTSADVRNVAKGLDGDGEAADGADPSKFDHRDIAKSAPQGFWGAIVG